MTASASAIASFPRAVGRASVPTDRNQPGYGLLVSKQGATKFGEFLDNFLRKNTGRFPDARAFAASAGVSEAAVSRWRHGVDRPNANALAKIAPLVGVRVRDLFALAYPEHDDDEAPVALPTFEEYLASLGLDEEQVQIIKSVHDQFVAANRARPSRRGATRRSDDQRPAI